MNMIEKILAKASGKREVGPGEVVVASVDRMVMHDLSANFVTRVFREELGGGSIKDPSRIAFVFDHNFSPATQEAAQTLFKVRQFAREYGIQHVFNGGNGSLHHVIIENGLWAPGQIIIGCDSHTPIYGALGAFATGVGNNSMAALGFQHGLAHAGSECRLVVGSVVLLLAHHGDQVFRSRQTARVRGENAIGAAVHGELSW